MAQLVHVNLADRSYDIRIDQGSLTQIGADLQACGFPKRVAIVTNPTVADLYLEQVRSSLDQAGFVAVSHLIPDGEQFKSIATLESIFDFLIEGHFDRHTGLVALGGGVVGDIVGFAAACFLRGIPFAQVPTTLLSQVDSSVGGKTAVNHPLGKNLIGAFYQPRFVAIDVDTLASLPEREYSAGLAEVIKYGVIRDRAFFDWLRGHVPELSSRDRGVLVEAVTRSCQIKADIVERDERESSVRAYLNFGHTLGHAVENLVGYGTIKHGEAVAVGMVAAARISQHLQLCSEEDVNALSELLSAVGLPVELPSFTLQEYLETMYRDKKVHAGKLRFVVNLGIGSCEVREIEAPDQLLMKVFPQFVSAV